MRSNSIPNSVPITPTGNTMYSVAELPAGMEELPEAIGRAIAARNMRLAVFDTDLRHTTGQWRLETPIELAPVVAAFAAVPGCVEANLIKLPLHEPTSAALTDEYVVVDGNTDPPTVSFYDLAQDGLRTMPLTEFASSYPAWRLRYWSGEYPIETTPPWLVEFGTDVPESPPTDATGPSMEAAAFMEAARSALVARRETMREHARRRYEALSPAEYIDERGGISTATVSDRRVDEFGQQLLTLTPATQDPPGVRVGDEVLVDADGVDGLPVEAEVVEGSTDGIALAIFWDSARRMPAALDPDHEARITVGRLVDDRWFSTVATALTAVEEDSTRRARYAGHGDPVFDELPQLHEETLLNRDQRHTVRSVRAAADLFCIHAPPWTGVRRTLAEIIRHEVADGSRVVILSSTDKTLATLLSDELCARCADMDVDLAVDTRNDPIDRDRLQTADVVGCSIVRADRLAVGGADLAVLDRAATVGVSAGAVPFAVADRIALIGDPIQSIESPVDQRLDVDLPPSIFEHCVAAYGDRCLARLRCQYELHETIAAYPNTIWYEGTLVHGQRNRTRTIDTLEPIAIRDVSGTERETPTGSLYNDAEVEAVIAEIDDLIARQVDPAEIAVFTPYSAQIGKLRVALNGHEPGLGDTVSISRVDRTCCRAYDAVLLSLVRTAAAPTWSDRDRPSWRERGLAVALTRARKRLVLVADWDVVTAPDGRHPYADLATDLADRDIRPT